MAIQEIPRTQYLRKLRAFRGQDLIKVITGIRRCGKSTLLMQYQHELEAEGVDAKHIITCNFEERAYASMTWTDVYDTLTADIDKTGSYYIFLDEIQNLPAFEKLIDALYVRKNLDIYATGSNAYMLSSELATLLSGRYVAIHMQTLSFSEYLLAYPDERSYDVLFRRYINSSTFPEAVTLAKSSPESVNTYLRSLYDTIVIKDIVKRRSLRKTDNLERVIAFLFDNVGSVVSANNIAVELSKKNIISHNTVRKFIAYLTEAYLVYPIRLYNVKGKQILSAGYKYYVVDLGLKNILLSNTYDADLGHKLENVVYFELLRRGGEVYAGAAGNGEVDFVVVKANGWREYYQVAYTVGEQKTFERELRPLRAIRDSYPKFLLTLDYDDAVIDGIQKKNVIDWLTGTEMM